MKKFHEENADTPLKIFLVKTLAITAAIMVLLMFSVEMARSLIDSKLTKGGHAFWEQLEQRLYSVSDAPDLPPEKKEKILKALNKLAVKYHPYIEALTVPPTKQPRE